MAAIPGPPGVRIFFHPRTPFLQVAIDIVLKYQQDITINKENYCIHSASP